LMWFFFKSGHNPTLFQTGWFVESLLTQTMIVHIIRTNRIPFIQSSPSGALLSGTLVVMGIASWLPYSPFAKSLGMVPLPGIFWLWMLLFMVSYAFLCHYVKVWFHKKFGAD
jgi:Mg2+-importing ATPase